MDSGWSVNMSWVVRVRWEHLPTVVCIRHVRLSDSRFRSWLLPNCPWPAPIQLQSRQNQMSTKNNKFMNIIINEYYLFRFVASPLELASCKRLITSSKTKTYKPNLKTYRTIVSKMKVNRAPDSTNKDVGGCCMLVNDIFESVLVRTFALQHIQNEFLATFGLDYNTNNYYINSTINNLPYNCSIRASVAFAWTSEIFCWMSVVGMDKSD